MTASDLADDADIEALAKFFSESDAAAVAPYALVRRGKIKCFFDNPTAAAESGARAYSDRAFSVIDIRARRIVRRP
ncbi:hypothetical protein [Inquilinus limosus]|uniref:hypothetical protein n=1 Tax=Inquilinus limosus TaxID=171674 RepID=UPI0004048F91|nr:hypothetical protein [Inquilinus limosus]